MLVHAIFLFVSTACRLRAAKTFSRFSRNVYAGNFRGEIKQFLQRLIKAVELVLAQLIGRFEATVPRRPARASSAYAEAAGGPCSAISPNIRSQNLTLAAYHEIRTRSRFQKSATGRRLGQLVAVDHQPDNPNRRRCRCCSERRAPQSAFPA